MIRLWTGQTLGDPLEMMNWYKIAQLTKRASITFSIGDDDAYKIAQPKRILDLCHEMVMWIYENMDYDRYVFSPCVNEARPTTNSFDQFEGKFTFVSSPRRLAINKEDGERLRDLRSSQLTLELEIEDNPESPNSAAHLARIDQIEAELDEISITVPNSIEDCFESASAWASYMGESGYQINVDMGTLYESDPDYYSEYENDDFQVPIIDVVYNPSKEIEEIPAVNTSNANARAILELLGLSPDDVGRISVDELIQRINNVSNTESMESITKAPVVEYNDAGDIQMFIGGRDLEYVDRRLQGLYGLADWAKRNGFKQIGWH